MKQQRDGLGARAAAPSPPDHDVKDIFPESHVARSASSNPTLEINRTLELNLNDLEVVDELPPHLQDLVKQAFGSQPPPLPPEGLAQYSPTSEAPFQVPVRSEPPPARRSYVPIAIAGAIMTFAIGGVARLVVPRHAAASADVQAGAQAAPTSVAPETVAPAKSPEPPPATPAPASSAPVLVPVVEVVDLPRPHVGTITGSPGHRLWIDGTLATGWQQSVTCGSHTVQVGSNGASRTVDVPCGGAINVSP